jgi:hypothetical protein
MRVHEINLWLMQKKLRPVAFYGYTHGVSHVFLAQSHNYETDEHYLLEDLGSFIRSYVESRGVQWDNKVVVRCKLISFHAEVKELSDIYIGCYDGRWSVGLGLWGDSWCKPILL